MAIPAGTVQTYGTATTSGATRIANMTLARTVFDNTIPQLPNAGDVVQITATGKIVGPSSNDEIGFQLFCPDSVGACNNTPPIAVTASATYYFMLQFLITFRTVAGGNCNIESNGTVCIGNGSSTGNWSLNPTQTNNISTAQTCNVDVRVSSAEGSTITFDECVIEYLSVPS